jgi:origin recognition complex subunit 4
MFLPSTRFRSLLKQIFYTSKSIPELFSNLYIDIATVDSLDHQISFSNAATSISSDLRPPDSLLHVIPHLPNLHLCLLISTARLDAIHNATVTTFSIVYNHYVSLISRARMQASAAGSIAQATKIWDRDVAAAAWEDLADWEIILPANNTNRSDAEGLRTRTWRCDVALEEIVAAADGAGGSGMSDLMVRWCKEV